MAPLKRCRGMDINSQLPPLHDRKVMAPLKPVETLGQERGNLPLSMTERSWPH